MTGAFGFDPRPLAERVWREVGFCPAAPRDLIPPFLETFDVAVILLPRLTVAGVNDWLSRHGRLAAVRHRDRSLRGCLLARRGHGLVFIDGTMPEDERRFAVGHEFAHFFKQYLEPRRLAVARFGEAIIPVLDGERPATVSERLSSILKGVPLGAFEDLLDRDNGGVTDSAVQAAETEADLLALELIAPRKEVEQLPPGAGRITALRKTFGLPRWAAEKWDGHLNGLALRSDPLISSIARAVKKSS